MKFDMVNLMWSDKVTGVPDESLPVLKSKLNCILESWEGTPYGKGMQAKQVGVDCVRFVFGVLDELYGHSYRPTLKIPEDTAFHQPKTSVKAMNHLISNYPSERLVPYHLLELGDILITGAKGKGPGHAMIVGSEKNHKWHMDSHFVSRTGPLFTSGNSSLYYLYRIYRIKDKHLWI